MILYLAVNSITDQKYVGKTTKTLDERIKMHKKVMHRSKQYVHRAMVKYGFEKFNWTILEEVSEGLDEREKFWINNLNSLHPNGYNLSRGGEGGDNWSVLNRKHTEETKEKIRKKFTGVKFTEERRKHCSEWQIGRVPWNKGLKYKLGKYNI